MPKIVLEEAPVSAGDAPTGATGTTSAAPGETVGATDAEDVTAVGDVGHPEESQAIGEGHAEGHAREGQIFNNRRAGIFFSIYYMMTGIHAIHIIIGIIAISMLAWKGRRGKYTSVWYTPVENVGLYWHIVDIIWIFVFPLMYLI